MSCDAGHRHGSDPQLLWLWCRPAVLIGTQAWESPYTMGVALRDKKTEKKNLTAVAWVTTEGQWVKGSGIATAATYVEAMAQIQSLPRPETSICCGYSHKHFFLETNKKSQI